MSNEHNLSCGTDRTNRNLKISYLKEFGRSTMFFLERQIYFSREKKIFSSRESLNLVS